jgi:hypothetical protein
VVVSNKQEETAISAVDDFLIRTCMDIPLLMCGEMTHAKTDIALLDDCIKFGNYPDLETVIKRFNPIAGARRYSDGMRPLQNRRRILQCFEAFRDLIT